MPELEQESSSFDPGGRRLCPDGTCIGVIGSDGRCRVCGLPDGGGPGAALASPFPDQDDDADEGDDVAQARADNDAAGAGAFDPGRKLCVDGSCVGVIGPDGRCGECGRSAEG
jgi:hypothetical protein